MFIEKFLIQKGARRTLLSQENHNPHTNEKFLRTLSTPLVGFLDNSTKRVFGIIFSTLHAG
ncbi:hypothetical protein [Pyrococcus kukulkanii]|uniref:hypothetical protein n=1 Tax=Pyrococcus kukulkanii TaxID=1609559 RepID=UPI00356165B1